MNKFLKPEILLIFLLGSLFNSCRHVHVYDSKAIIISRSIDLSLNDSALVFGYVYSAVDERTREKNAHIWVEGSNINSFTDSLGYFAINLTSGKYTIKCLGQNSSNKMTIELNDISIIANEKIEIKFLQGVTIE